MIIVNIDEAICQIINIDDASFDESSILMMWAFQTALHYGSTPSGGNRSASAERPEDVSRPIRGKSAYPSAAQCAALLVDREAGEGRQPP
jgi:hypothetical protein